MELGTTAYFVLGKKQPVVDLVTRVYDIVVTEAGVKNLKNLGHLVKQRFRGREPQFFSSLDSWIAGLRNCESVVLELTLQKSGYSANERERFYKLITHQVKDGSVNMVYLLMASPMWMPIFDMKFIGYESVLQESIEDYKLCKRLFREFDAERCLGSCSGNYYNVDDRKADEAFRFTRNGPQKLIRPFEEERVPRWGNRADEDGPSDFESDILTGKPRWAWIVNKPFSEIKS